MATLLQNIATQLREPTSEWLGVAKMSPGRRNAITSAAVLLTVFVFGGVQALHSELAKSQHVIGKALPAATTSYFTCDTPDLAVLPVARPSAPPRLICGVVPPPRIPAVTCREDFPHDIRPPPVLPNEAA